MELTKGVSVVICCYNSADRLPTTLAHLAAQKYHPIPWEIIVVDNASTDNTSEVAIVEWQKYNLPVPFRVVNQPIPGQSNARMMGYEVAEFEYLLFVDDDNWLQEDYLQLAYGTISSNPNIGILGGQCEGVFEITPPEWFYKKSGVFAVGKQSDRSGVLTDPKRYLYGAACVIRRSAWEKLRQNGFQMLTTGRSGKLLIGGDDVELNKAIKLVGYELYYDERLFFKHLMTVGRLNWEYLLKIGKGGAVSNIPLLVYDYFLSTKSPSLAGFKKFYVKEIAGRAARLVIRPAALLKNFSDVGEGDIPAFESMRSLTYLKSLIISYHQAIKYYHAIHAWSSKMKGQTH